MKLTQLFLAFTPNVIVNAAAWTNVDLAEDEPDTARAINVDGPKNLATVARTLGAKLIHISTDYVFSGTGVEPWSEGSVKFPASVYGSTKSEGEDRALEIHPGRNFHCKNCLALQSLR
ncbi:MAG: sugar nucleotide-binding protein [Actinomycetota bacterium]